MKATVHYTSFAEYMAACDSDSSKRVAHYAEQERQAAEEAQQAKDAARYRLIRKFSIKEGSSPLGKPVSTDEQFDAEVDALLAELAATEQ